MAKNDFKTVIALIRAFFKLITDLVPIAGDCLDLIDRISQIIADYKAEKGLANDN